MTAGPKNIEQLNEMASRPTEEVIESLKSVDSDVLVVGAGGKMGFHLSRMLQRGLEANQSKHRVIAVSRFGTPAATKLFDEHEIETISVDLTKANSIAGLPDSTNVFFLAGVKFGTSDRPELLHQMNVELPTQIAQRFSDARIVALSTGCVYGFTTPQSGGSVESDRLEPPGQYAKSCLGRETAFMESGVKVSLIRLNYSVDLRYGVLVDIASKVLQEQPVDVSTGFANVIWQGDANVYIIQALNRATTPAFVVNVTGAETLSVREMANRFGKLFGKPVSIVGTENPTAWLSNASQAHKLWGRPTVHEDQLIEWVAQWLLNDGETLNKPTHFEVRDGRY